MCSKSEIKAQAIVVFAKYDTNGDGGLDNDECREFFRFACDSIGYVFTEEKYQAAFT